jgi:hypothetical protein
MLAATNPGHPVSAPTPTPAPAPAPHMAPAPSTIPQLTQTGMHPPYHGVPPPQMPSFYPPQIPVHPSPAAAAPPPHQQQQQQHMAYYGVPQLPPPPPPPAAPTAAIDSIDPSQKVLTYFYPPKCELSEPRPCCSKSSVSHKNKLASFHLRRGTLSSLSDPSLVTLHDRKL